MKSRPLSHRILSLACTLLLALSCLPGAALAADTNQLPNGWWPVWEPYENALNSGNAEQIVKTGDAVLAFFAQYPLDVNIGELSINIRQKRLDMLYYEGKGDYAGAIENTTKLRDLADYMNKNSSIDYSDTYTRCIIHLDLLSPFTGVYAASYTQRSNYASRIAPVSGSLYGSVFQGYLADNGNGRGSIASVYVELERETAEGFDYLIQPIAKGGQVLQINLNYENKGTTARAIPTGAYDRSIQETLSYLATLSCPVMLRIGGEMNIWGNPQQITDEYVTPADFIRSYRYIADKARAVCPKVELVWSPMYICRWGETFEEFWPGDNYVDWVGMSFYFNHDRSDSDAIYWIEATRSMQFTDPLLSAKSLVAFAKQHNKPVAATEGGAYKNGSRGEAYAAALTAKEYAAVTMVYPEIKSLVHFDMNINEVNGRHDYTMTGSLRNQTLSAIDANPSLISRGESSAATYIPAEKYNEAAKDGKIIFGATGYTYNDRDMRVTYALDGKETAGTGASNRYVLDTAAVGSGAHTLKVTFTDSKGYSESKSYRIEVGSTVKITVGEAPAQQTPAPAANGAPGVSVKGKAVQWTDAAPFIDANSRTLVPLRAVGAALGLNVDWDGTKREASFSDGNKTIYFPIDRSSAHTSDGKSITMDTAAVIVNSRTYAPIRPLAEFFGFSVEWDGTSRTVIIK